MEPLEHRQMEDSELREILGAWKAPPTPPDLARRILRRRSTWRWFLKGSIRVPVPLGAAVVVLLAVWAYGRATSSSITVSEPRPVSLADFRPVPQFEPRLVGDVR
jgi:hypothetical protein